MTPEQDSTQGLLDLSFHNDNKKTIIHLVSFSGGMGSFAEAVACVKKFGASSVQLLFADTNMEDEDLYRFMDECVSYLGVPLTVIKDGRTPFEVFKDVRFMGNSRVDPCSNLLKREILNKYVKENFSADEVNVHLGIDFSEGHRLDQIRVRMAPYVYRSTLVEDGLMIDKSYSESFGIKRPRLYDWKLGHNNCGGFCVKAGLGHYKNLFLANKNRYLEFEKKEQEVYDCIGEIYPFLRKTENGNTRYLTLKQFREEYLEKDLLSKEDSSEFGGCGCAL